MAGDDRGIPERPRLPPPQTNRRLSGNADLRPARQQIDDLPSPDKRQRHRCTDSRSLPVPSPCEGSRRPVGRAEVPGHPKRPAPCDDDAEKALKKRMMAMAMDYRTDNPCDRVLPVLGPRNDIVTHRLALPHKDVAGAVETVRASASATPVVKLAFEFLVLTAARSGEVARRSGPKSTRRTTCGPSRPRGPRRSASTGCRCAVNTAILASGKVALFPKVHRTRQHGDDAAPEQPVLGFRPHCACHQSGEPQPDAKNF